MGVTALSLWASKAGLKGKSKSTSSLKSEEKSGKLSGIENEAEEAPVRREEGWYGE